MKVAIAGFGLEGESSYRYYSAQGHDVTILDESSSLHRPTPPKVEVRLGSNALSNLSDFDMVIRTAGIAPSKLKDAKRVWSSTNEFFEKCPAPIIGVTGTKGKSTTSTMIASILKQTGKTVHLVGNIGISALDVLSEIDAEDIVVYELSSFQLWDLNFSPHVAVVLPVGSDHLDAHGDVENYIAAKANITAHQVDDDYVIYNSDSDASERIAARSRGQKISYTSGHGSGVYRGNDGLYSNNEKLCDISAIQLPGDHNVMNACAAATAAQIAGADAKSITSGLSALDEMPHRMQSVASIDGVTYIDDNYSSSPIATVAAVQVFETPTVVIIGGRDRGADWRTAFQAIVAQPHLKHVICIGEVRDELADYFMRSGQVPVTVCSGDIHEIVDVAKSRADSGDVVVMSPGFASFDMFQNFTDRGEQFKYALEALSKDKEHTNFFLEDYSFDATSKTARFRYSFDHHRWFEETYTLASLQEGYNQKALDRALRIAHIVVGTSYYKCFPDVEIVAKRVLSDQEILLAETVYRQGMSQFIFENRLSPSTLGRVTSGEKTILQGVPYSGEGVLALQSGGKDSLLLSELLHMGNYTFDALYISSSDDYPAVIDDVGSRHLRVSRRSIDRKALDEARSSGALNGHVPVSFIVYAYALIDAIANNEKTVLMAVGHEGEEPHAVIEGMEVTHQWSKTWSAEQLFASVVRELVSPDIEIGSPLRKWTELRISELFVNTAWAKYASQFSSCNIANYKLGEGKRELEWCGNCAKCANSYLLFSAFVDADELKQLFGGADLYEVADLQNTFRGLLGIDEMLKPFECIGEVDELRLAYTMSQTKGGYSKLSFAVPESDFDYMMTFDAQSWTARYSAIVEERNI